MEQQRDLMLETLPPDTAPGRSYALARLISQVFHPMILSVVSFLIVGLYAMPRWFVGLGWALFGIILQVIPPTVFFCIRLRQGAYSDEDVSVRQQRNELYFFSLLTLITGLGVLWWLQAPLPFLALLCSALLLAMLGWAINYVWKISVHASSAASCAAIGLMYDQSLGLFLGICALLVGWSRVRTRNHTPLQVLAGFLVATVGVWGVFAAFGLV